jgi:hypothetical protein
MIAYIKTDGGDGSLQIAYGRDEATGFEAEQIGEIRDKPYVQSPDLACQVESTEGNQRKSGKKVSRTPDARVAPALITKSHFQETRTGD